jgi:hypothetical protein
MQAALKAQINQTDRNDARGIAQMARAGLYRPVHVKTLAVIVLAIRLRRKRHRRRAGAAFIIIAIAVLYFVRYPPCHASIGLAC